MKSIRNILLSFFLYLSVVLLMGLTACVKVDFKYTIDFVVDGKIIATVGTDSERISMPDNPTKEGFTFDGWYWDENKWNKEFTLHSIADQPLQEENRFKVYAKWKSATEYTVELNNGLYGLGEMPALTLKVGERAVLPESLFKAQEGYAFAGWNTELEGTGISYADRASVSDLCAAGESTVLYAQWRKGVCTVTFNANGGSGSMQSKQVNTYVYVETPCEFTPPTGKFFAGWNTKPDGSGERCGYRENLKLSVKDGASVTVYAQWADKVKQYYTISFSANGGRGTMSPLTAETDVEVVIGASTFTYPDSDYAFSGWNTAADGSGQSISAGEAVVNLAEANGKITLYAQWAYNMYTISFVNSYNEDVYFKTRKVAKGEYITLGGANGFTAPEYCRFECWRVQADINAVTLSQYRGIGENEQVVDLAKVGETAYLIADWKISDGIQLRSVSNFSQLQAALADKVSANTVVVLEKDIDCAGKQLPSCPEFGGVFIGNGHKIKNLNIQGDSSGETQRGGLFGNITETGKVRGLALENLYVTGSYAASFAYKNEGELRSCYVVNGTVNFVGNPLNTNVMGGGLVCENASGNIIDCYYSGEIVGNLQSGNGSATVAGICVNSQGYMENVYFYGYIDVSGNIEAANLFCITWGGSIGKLGYCQKQDCYVNGTVYDGSLDFQYATKWTEETLYANRYDMACVSGGIMYSEMDLQKGSLGYVGISANNWYHA